MTFRRPKLRNKTAVAMALLLTAVVAASMSIPPSSTVLAQSSGICERTQEVRDAILAKLSDVSDCANVTDSHLAGITGDLTLSDKSISALKTGDFQGLSGLEQLYLDTNNLSDLPDGIFEGLESLDTLWLNFNTGSPFSLTMTLEQEGSNSVVVRVAEGAPFDMEITLSAEGGTLSSTTVTVEGGSLKSEAVSVSPSDQSRVQTADVQVTVSVESSDFSATDYSSYFGLTWEEADDLELTLAASPGICGRTQEVQDAILALLSDVSDCADITDTHLAGITKLVVSFTSATSIKSGDFAGLSSMTWLQPTGSSYIRSVPEDVFEGLGNLQRLYLFLDLTALSEDVFDGLSSLQILALGGTNQIRELHKDVFDGLSSLTDLRLHNNQLSELDEDIFDGLGSLENIVLSTNPITALPEDLFDGLTNLDRLIFTNNKLSALPDGIFQDLGDLETLYMGNNPGTPFTFTAELEQRGDNGVVVKVAEGAPFNMSVTLNFKAGTLSSNLVVPVNGGDLVSSVITSPIADDDGVTVTVAGAVFLEGSYVGIQTGLGESLTLSSSTPTPDGGSENTPATGAPTITGTAQVGQTLTGGTTGISDSDGLDSVSYSYQWLSDDTEIDEATSSTYALQSSDNGKVIKVRVTFTDDAGNEESLTSEGTEAVVLGGL